MKPEEIEIKISYEDKRKELKTFLGFLGILIVFAIIETLLFAFVIVLSDSFLEAIIGLAIFHIIVFGLIAKFYSVNSWEITVENIIEDSKEKL